MPTSFSVFRFRNETNRPVKITLLDGGNAVLKIQLLHAKTAAASIEILEEYILADTIRHGPTVYIKPRGRMEVPVKYKTVLASAGFCHGPEAFERFWEHQQFSWEPNRWIFIGDELLGRRGNTWWTDIALAGAGRLGPGGRPADDGGEDAAGAEGFQPRNSSRASTMSLATTASLGSPPPTPEGVGVCRGLLDRRPETPQVFACTPRSPCLTSRSTTPRREKPSLHNSLPPELQEVPTPYEAGQSVFVFSSSFRDWIAGKVVKVSANGAVRVRYGAAFQKELPAERIKDLLRPAGADQ